MFIYSDTGSVRSGFVVPYDKLNATKAYLTHYGNYLYLKFILDNSSDRMERHQANKEIVICDRKLSWWSKHPNIDRLQVEEGKKELQHQWNSKRS